ncbi:MAG: hypothetical protein HRT83_00385 [Hyphomicrobiaceae bacterium]|nr:hypothetical protein [Hyphomicrobiaceae bacterium]
MSHRIALSYIAQTNRHRYVTKVNLMAPRLNERMFYDEETPQQRLRNAYEKKQTQCLTSSNDALPRRDRLT